MISSDGEFFYCDNEFYPWGTGRIWVIDGFNTIMQIDDEQSERVSLFNMRSCEEIEVLYEVKDQNSDEHIREAAYSLKGWLAISRWMDNHEEILLLIHQDQRNLRSVVGSGQHGLQMEII